MPRKVKVYGWTANCGADTAAALGDAPHIRQCRAVVATTSKAAAARIAGREGPWQLFNLGETGNQKELDYCLNDIGAIYIASMQGGRPLYHKYDLAKHGSIY